MSPRVYAIVTTAHGYGHATRQLEVIRALLTRDPEARVALLTAAPPAVVHNYLGDEPAIASRVTIEPLSADVGLVQHDGLRMNAEATLAALDARFGDEARAVADMADRLAAHRPSVVLADIPPVVFPAAAKLSVPAVGISNFDWAFIYGCYARQNAAFARWEQLFLRWQGEATLGIHLDPGPPLQGFREVVSVAPLARRKVGDVAAIRRALDIPPGHKAVLASFGGCGLDEADRRIPRIEGVTWLLAPPMLDLHRSDTRFAPEVPFVTLLAAADAVFMKPGYGTVCEAAYHRTRMLYTDRGDFPEYEYLVAWMEREAPCVHVPSHLLGTETGAQAIADGLERLFALPERWPASMSGAEEVAQIIERAAIGGSPGEPFDSLNY
ncbi:MAG: hypothetical protein U0359_06300 [Byssovorax sp.]